MTPPLLRRQFLYHEGGQKQRFLTPSSLILIFFYFGFTLLALFKSCRRSKRHQITSITFRSEFRRKNKALHMNLNERLREFPLSVAFSDALQLNSINDCQALPTYLLYEDAHSTDTPKLLCLRCCNTVAQVSATIQLRGISKK